MMEFGKSLRAAREAKGYSSLQLAELTRLAPSVVEALENEDFSGIAAPIYGRGFVKLYCEAVGLAPKPFIDQFMDILTGNHEPHIRERPLANEPPAESAPEAPVAEPVSEPIPEAPPLPPPQDLFRSQTPLDEKSDFTPTPEPEQAMSKYATSFRTTRTVSLPISWRKCVLALAALAIALLLFFGLMALHRTTTSAPMSTDAAAETPPQETPAADEPASANVKPKEAAPRTAQDIPDLYID